VVAPDGSTIIRQSATGDPADAARLGRGMGEQLLAAGAQDILEAVYGA